MSALDEVNEEWKKQDARLDEFRAKAKLMHDTLIKEIEQSQYDLYKRDEVERLDNLAQVSAQLVKSDAKLRTTLKGPTIVKEKFHPSYWKRFNDERDLLEDISRKQFSKTHSEQQQQQQSKKVKNLAKLKSSTTSSFPPTKDLLHSSKSYTILKGDYLDHNWKSTVFASPVHLQNDLDHETRYFDQHLLGRNNSVSHLTQLAYPSQAKLKKSSSAFAVFDPQAIGIAAVKGGAMTLSPPRPKEIESLTKTCEIPDLAASVKSIVGGSFAHSERFPNFHANRTKTTNPATATASPSFEATASILPSSSSTSFLFPTAKRFSSEEEEKNKSLLNTPGPGTYTVSYCRSSSLSCSLQLTRFIR